ncbi:MAG: SMP-30/gluconolactonase/LRE family protein [Candidatus Latescibacteria bacterium]|nr:SMP-30/gluconolactonase/LRE family protein [Candidatus Latescibacterota bacterium]
MTLSNYNSICVFLITLFLFIFSLSAAGVGDVLVAPGAEIVHITGGYAFTEGPTANSRGDVFFSDSHRDHILRWSVDGELSTFRKPSGGAMGLFFDHEDNLIVCAGSNRKLVSINPHGNTKILADSYRGMSFNRPNDVCSHPEVGIFFTDPRSRRSGDEAVSRVFHLSPDYKYLTAVIENMIYPNGLITTSDGKMLYIADWSAQKVYSYTIGLDGILSNPRLIASVACDGMTLDERGNIYLTGEEGVMVYNSKGERIALIKVPETPANVCFGGADRKTLFITAETSLYSLKMNVRGAY